MTCSDYIFFYLMDDVSLKRKFRNLRMFIIEGTVYTRFVILCSEFLHKNKHSNELASLEIISAFFVDLTFSFPDSSDNASG